MALQAPVESCVAVVSASELGKDVYTNQNSLIGQDGVRSVSGCFLVGQALSAANATVRPAFLAYSSQSSFIRPARADTQEKVVYRVEQTADGRTYATRIVHAFQGKACVYTAIISFQNNTAPVGNTLRYHTSKPEVDRNPEDISPQEVDRFNNFVIDKSVPVLNRTSDEMPFDWRFIGMDVADKPSDFRLRAFVRSPPFSTSNPSSHLAALAYLSDEFLFGIAVVANPRAVGPRMRNITMATSLNHSVSFHDPQVRVDDWLVVERETSWGDEGRVLVHQRMWNVSTGRMVLSGIQEALVRLKDAKL
ncbi:Thioesterase/thiol ester dehydrase-isomerase [Hypoxylon sp. FL1150]|nr:Thioesterase/thiol ester dehydrase-isomerase [Hypoxylon sp. FL1150]